MLKDIKQKRLAAREELKAVLHTLSLAGMELHKPDHVLRPVDTSSGELRLLKGNKPFLWNPSTGNGQWDYVWDCSALRLVVSPDEGGPFGVPSFGCLREGTKCTSCETNCDSSASQAFTHLFSSVAMSFSRLIYLNSISLPSLSLSPFLLQSLRLSFCLVSECSSLPACLPVCLPKLGLICAMEPTSKTSKWNTVIPQNSC